MSDKLDHIEMIPASEARGTLSDLVKRVKTEGTRIGITNHNKPVGAIVPITDLEFLESLDAQAIEKREAEEAALLSSPIDWNRTVEVAQIAIAGDGSRQFANYLAGQVAALLVHERVVRDKSVLNSILAIVKETIGSALDNHTMPNPPSEYVHYGFVDQSTFAEAAHVEQAGGAMYFTAHATPARIEDIHESNAGMLANADTLTAEEVMGFEEALDLDKEFALEEALAEPSLDLEANVDAPDLVRSAG